MHSIPSWLYSYRQSPLSMFLTPIKRLFLQLSLSSFFKKLILIIVLQLKPDIELLVWRQLLVDVGGNIKIVYLDTSLQELLYGPSITPVALNWASTCLLIVYVAT